MSQRLDQQELTTSSSGGYLHIIKPDLESITGYKSYKIAASNFLPSGGSNSLLKGTGFTSNFSLSFPNKTLIQSCKIFIISGTLTIKIGSMPNSDDIMKQEVLDSSLGSVDVEMNKYFSSLGSIYFTISGATIDVSLPIIVNFK